MSCLNRIAKRMLVLVLMFICVAAGASFQTPVAVSPDGVTVAVPKDRVIYLVDTETMRVRQRLWAGAKVTDLAFSTDSAVLYVGDDSGRILAFSTDSETPVVVHAGTSNGIVAMNAKAGIWVAAVSHPEPLITVKSLTDGSVLRQIPTAKDFQVAAWAIADDGSRIAAFSRGKALPEEKEDQAEKPAKSDGKLAESEFRERHDGRGCEMHIFSLGDEVQVTTTMLWVEVADASVTAITGNDLYAFRYSNPCRRIQLDKGTVELFMSPVFCNYGLGFSVAANTYIAGGLANYAYVKLGSDPIAVEIPRDQRLPGWPEYFYGFGISDDGQAFGWTSAGRLAKIAPDGKLLDLVPVY